MPNVPNVPGVPALVSYSIDTIVLLAQDLIGSIGGNFGSQWGIFLNGEQVLDYDNVVSFGHRQDFPVSDYPVEDGGFQSYDKVQLPFGIRVRVSAGGSDARRQAFLSSIDAVMNTLDLYDVVTPEAVYPSCNFVHRDVERTATDGAGLITVDLHLTEIRITATATFNDTQAPPTASQQNIGNVQAQPVPDNIQQNFAVKTWTVQ